MDDTDRRIQELDDEILADALVLHAMDRRPQPDVDTPGTLALLALLSSSTGRLDQATEDAHPQRMT